jgi:hypothetical protein
MDMNLMYSTRIRQLVEQFGWYISVVSDALSRIWDWTELIEAISPEVSLLRSAMELDH